MKRNLLLILFLVLLGLPAFAQQSKEDKEAKRKEFLEIKLQYLADEMDLTEDQRKAFNEVYTQMENERRSVYRKMKEAEKSVSKKDASEEEYEKAYNEINEARDKMQEIEKKYDEKFATFLSKRQLFKMKEAEESFKDKVRKCRDKKKNEKK